MRIKQLKMNIKPFVTDIKKVAKAKAPLPYSLIFFHDKSLLFQEELLQTT